MIAKIHHAAIKAALDETKVDSNPFFMDGDNALIRHDEIRIADKGNGMMVVEFLWRGIVTATIEARCELSKGESFTLTGIQGTMRVDLV